MSVATLHGTDTPKSLIHKWFELFKGEGAVGDFEDALRLAG